MANADALIGRTVSNHSIIETLGRGGLVYTAEDTDLDRFVALKFAFEHLARDRQLWCAVTVHPVKALSSGGCDAK
jgi:hypothetical protein